MARRQPSHVGDFLPEGTPTSNSREVVLRRSWPQRLVVVACLVVIVGALVLAWGINRAHGGAQQIIRVFFPDSAADVTTPDSATETGDNTGVAAQPDIPIGTIEVTRTPDDNGPLLIPNTPPEEPVNFLLVGTDSALGLDPDDPVLDGRYVDPNGRSRADAIMLVRLDPASGSAWVLSIPRDLWAEIPRAQDHRIASALWIGGPPLLVETITSMFDLEINHYVQVDFAGFKSLVDTLGGIPVWFPYPARDPGSRLNIPTAGCHVLNGEQALQYVRGRSYRENIDGRWRITGANDFTRIARQQDFMVLALDRAIDRGARNPITMTRLIEAGAESVSLDQDFTLAEMIALGEAFSAFNPQNLHRLQLEVYTVWNPDGSYKGEAAYVRKNEAALEVFRGKSDAVPPADVPLQLVASSADALTDATNVLSGEGFVIQNTAITDQSLPETVVLHGPDHAAAALTVARYLDPVPYVVGRDDVDGVVAALGDDYRGVLFLFQPPQAEVAEQVAARGVPAVIPSTVTNAPGDSTPGDSTEPVQSVTSTSTTTSTTVPRVIAGRPPEGESCG